ncbi:hypothetical protein ACSAZK_17875 [Methanosarcina sp. Mfa9]|uniref:hypothetical protein n=1 Tax=Methanosarcina sp. Mfa9 TaxID=3439063 RepID=UPI003F873DC2
MYSDDDSLTLVVWMFLIAGGFLSLIVLLKFLTSPQTGSIAGYPITMPGFAWLGLPAFAILILVIYAKNRM